MIYKTRIIFPEYVSNSAFSVRSARKTVAKLADDDDPLRAARAAAREAKAAAAAAASAAHAAGDADALMDAPALGPDAAAGPSADRAGVGRD